QRVAPLCYRAAGPPESTIPAGRLARSSASGASCGTISEYTWHSRIRRAINCAYCAPRSTTRTGRSASSKLVAHAHALLRLVGLALRLDRRRDHELGLLELLDRCVPRGGHRRSERAEQVERAVVLVRRSHEDLLQARDLLGLHSRPARKGRMEGGHAPVVATARSFVRAG